MMQQSQFKLILHTLNYFYTLTYFSTRIMLFLSRQNHRSALKSIIEIGVCYCPYEKVAKITGETQLIPMVTVISESLESYIFESILLS